MSTLEAHYPTTCPFCTIAAAYPPSPTSPVPTDPPPDRVAPECYLILSTPHVLAFLDILPISPGHILLTTREHHRTLGDLYAAGTPATEGQQTWDVLRKRQHARTTAQAIGAYLPLVSRALCEATGIEDWNVVQNNGERAAQVVPHVHFHLIPRYQEGRRETARKGNVDVGMLKSWRMFGRGTREELDEDEAREMAAGLREAVQREVDRSGILLEGGAGLDGKGSGSKL